MLYELLTSFLSRILALLTEEALSQRIFPEVLMETFNCRIMIWYLSLLLHQVLCKKNAT